MDQVCNTRKFAKYSETRKIAVIILKFEQSRVMRPKDADGMANSVDPDQTAPIDLGFHCLPRPVCPKTEDQV